MQFQSETNRIFTEDSDGVLIAEITFPQVREGVVNINHTFVDESLQGQGIASKLAAAAALQIRENHLKAEVTCSYAQKWFEKHPDEGDILTTASV